jgi:xylan 1,4-beta-xylosidase
MHAQSVLNNYTFVNDFKGETISDANQTTANPLLGTQSDGKFEISFPDGISSYKAVYNTGFAHSIDMSETADQKLRVRFTYTGTPGTFRFYLSDADGTNRFIDVMPTEGLNEKELSYNSGWTEGGTVSGFDLSQVVRFNVSTGGSAVSAGKLAFEWLHIGAEYIPLTLGFETFTSTRGLTLTASPAAPMIGENAFLFKDPVTNEPATGVTATLLDGGAKFNFRGLDINKSYRIAIEDALFYLNKSYTVSGGGMTEGAPIVEVRPSVIFTSVDMVIVDFNKAAVGLGKDNFVLKNAATGDIIPIDYVTSGFVGKEYQLFTALEAGKNYTLEIAAENYLFGDPLEVATGLRPNPVGPGVIWEQVLGKITADHWGLNHIMSGGYSNGHYEDVHPGIVRIMGAGFTGSDWVNTEKEHWDTLRVKTFMDANKDRFDVIHNGGGKILLSIYKPPMTQTLPIADLTTEDKEVALLGQLPGVIWSLGYYIDMYEVFNESDGVYWGSGKPNNLAEYVRVLSKTARAMKATDPTVKVGGPATAWSYAEVYKAFGDNCLDDMDFFSFHMYSGGTAEMTDMSALFPGYTSRVSSAASVVNYFKEKGKTNYDVYLNEWLTGSWSPYEPCQDNHIGAAWMAVTIKNLALAGVTGTNVWYYRINENMAGSQLYKLSRDHLRGDIVYSKTNSSVEILPVLSAEGKKNVLIINKTKSSITITNAKSLIGGDASKMVAMRLDESTVLNPELANTSGVRYGVDVMPKVPQDILLLPYGMILLSDDGGQNLGIETSLPTESNAFRVFPNPFAETVYISGEGGVLNIYNVMGVKVGSRTVERNQTVSLGNLPRGQYIFQLINNGKVQTVKAVKK